MGLCKKVSLPYLKPPRLLSIKSVSIYCIIIQTTRKMLFKKKQKTINDKERIH